MGYYDTLRVFNNLYGQYFYLEDMWSPKKAYKFIDNLSEVQVKGLAEVLHISPLPYKRCLYEKIIPGLMAILKIPDLADYNMILLYILEYLGKMLEINRYQLFDMSTLIDLVREKLHERSDETVDWYQPLVQLMKTTKLYTHTFKDEVIIGCAQIIITGNKGGNNGLQGKI